MVVEGGPDTENVLYMDEYPELAKKVWLRRLAASRLGGNALGLCQIIPLPLPINYRELMEQAPGAPDGA